MPTDSVVRPMKRILYTLTICVVLAAIMALSVIWLSLANVKILENHLGINLYLTGFELKGIRDQKFVLVYQTDPPNNSVYLWAIYPWRSNSYTTEKFKDYN